MKRKALVPFVIIALVTVGLSTQQQAMASKTPSNKSQGFCSRLSIELARSLYDSPSTTAFAKNEQVLSNMRAKILLSFKENPADYVRFQVNNVERVVSVQSLISRSLGLPSDTMLISQLDDLKYIPNVDMGKHVLVVTHSRQSGTELTPARVQSLIVALKKQKISISLIDTQGERKSNDTYAIAGLAQLTGGRIVEVGDLNGCAPKQPDVHKGA
jgi:hypothetical protein